MGDMLNRMWEIAKATDRFNKKSILTNGRSNAPEVVTSSAIVVITLADKKSENKMAEECSCVDSICNDANCCKVMILVHGPEVAIDRSKANGKKTKDAQVNVCTVSAVKIV